MNDLGDIMKIEDKNERKVAEFLHRIGFSFVSSRSTFKKSESEIAWEIDLLFTFQNYAFIVEVSTQVSCRTEKIMAFFYRWEKQRNLQRLKKKHPKIPNYVVRIFFDLSKTTPENKSQDVEEAASEKGNRVFYKDDFDRFNSNENIEMVSFLGSNWTENAAKII